MPISRVDIANMALSNIGAKDNIENFDEASVEARTAKLWYDQSRIQTLEAFDWNFARKRVALALDSSDPPEGVWAFRYQYPSDCLRARKLERPGLVAPHPTLHTHHVLNDPDAVPFSIEISNDGERKTILSDLSEAVLVYTFDQTNVPMFSRFFITALSYALAHNMAFKITGKLSVKEEMMQRFFFTVNQAAAHDANESVDRKPREAEWIRGRY